MTPAGERPLLTFFVCAYKQEQFVREAVESAFAQTYSPLEILLSDDCSPDRTFEIMEEMAAAYRGPHRVKLNRNATNQRMAGHFNRIAELGEGELFVGNAGDDVSLPERTEVIVQQWLQAEKSTYSIYSNSLTIDSASRLLDGPPPPRTPQHSTDIVQAATRIKVGVPGCTHAWRREVFEVFGPLPGNVVNEDEALTFRSLLLGTIQHVPEPLVHYRRHEENISGHSGTSWNARAYRDEYRRRSAREKAVFDSWLRDVQTARARNLRPESMLDEAERGIRTQQRYLELELRLVDMSTPRAMLETLKLACSTPQRRSAARAFVRTQIPMSLRTWRTRAFGNAPAPAR
jgi:glycosyltransferase involved in cell wall biosynthesis